MMNIHSKVSIITPVYNAEFYLSKFFESIKLQTYQNYELILINDGSTDRSGDLCDAYANQDDRVKVFHTRNGGVASARQRGVDHASGLFSIHADPDDYLDPDGIEYLVTNIGDNDIIIAGFFRELGTRTVYESFLSSSTSRTDLIKALFERKLHGALWNKLVRHELYRKANIRFVEGINFCEDQLVFLQLLCATEKIAFTNKAFYHYVVNEQSITRDKSKNFFEKVDQYLDEVDKFDSIPSHLKELNHLFFKVDKMYSKHFDDRYIVEWKKPCNKLMLSSSLTIFTKIRLGLYFIGLGSLAKKTY